MKSLRPVEMFVGTASIVWLLAGCSPTAALPERGGQTVATVNSDARSKSESEPSAWQPRGKFIDLTHPFDETTIYWPTGEEFQLRKDFAGVTEKGYYYASNTFTTAEHGGTHIDAPIHFFQDGHTVDKIPLKQLVAEGVLVDVSEKCAADRDYQIGVDDLRAWEEEHDRQLVDVMVLLKTGFAKHWPNREKYMGTSDRGEQAVAQLHFPGLAPEAARWLVEHRAPLAIGIDTPSIDFGQSTHFQTHVTLFKHQVPALENVNITDDVPETNFTLIALPINIAGGSGGPTRVVAVVPP